MIHPDTELRRINSDIGFGVFATARIPRGTVTWVLDELDMVMTPARVAQLPTAYRPILDRYSFLDARGDHVLCWDFGRYMNHSCDANTLSVGAICDLAARDILPGEQLTCEYSLLNLNEQIDCQCGSPNCRGKVAARDLAELARSLDEKTAALVPEIERQKQPLLPFMLTAQRGRLEAILAGKAPVPSCLENRR